jgi:hypothetical protein
VANGDSESLAGKARTDGKFESIVGRSTANAIGNLDLGQLRR